MTDKGLLRERFSGACGSYEQEATVQKAAAAELASIIRKQVPDGFRDKVLEVGCGTGLLTRELLGFIPPEGLYLNDICPEFSTMFTDTGTAGFIAGDAETVDFPSGLGLIASASAIQWFSDPGAFFRKCHRSLREGGYLAFSTFGPGNLRETARVSGQALRYLAPDELEAMLSPGYRTIQVSDYLSTLHFPTPADVLRHLKRTGVNGLSRRKWTRKDLSDFCRTYSELFGTAGGCTLTYHPVFVLTRKQQDTPETRI